MARKKKSIRYKKERVILSDVLPYELPITFSNRYFYDFLLEHKVQFHKDVEWAKGTPVLDTIMCLLFCATPNHPIETSARKYFDKNIDVNTFKKDNALDNDRRAQIPFSYLISHKNNEYRELKICHPLNQVQLINFYDRHKETILYFCNKSEFSVRRPARIAKFLFHRDKAHFDALDKNAGSIEEAGREYESLRSFFVYREYSNIYKFYESYKHHHCEKKYNKLLKLDISKCFDSIYSHSISWALLGKDAVKESLSESNSTFSGQFDKLMQRLNYNETNGIIIGPEFSRIFAELILQEVDKNVMIKLQSSQPQYIHKKDYEVFRYVDDYFIFYNDEVVIEAVKSALHLELKEYKLHLNSSKAILYEKPIITEISMAKQKIAQLIDKKLKYDIEVLETFKKDEDGNEIVEKYKIGNISLQPNILITQFKTIIKEYEVEYADLLNYALAIIERKSIQILKDYQEIEKNENSEKNLVQALLAIIEFTFFIYSVSPKVNTTIKLCRLINTYISFLKSNKTSLDLKHLVYKSIYDNTCFILKKNKNSHHTQVETLYLLVTLAELGKEYWLDKDLLCSYFDINLKPGPQSAVNLNYLSITVLLFYMKDKVRYKEIRSYIEDLILEKFKSKPSLIRKDTELVLLLFDTITCPYINPTLKYELLKLLGIPNKALQDEIIEFRPYWFTKWANFDFRKELDVKQGQEVY